MSKGSKLLNHTHQLLLPTLFDRLLDDAPLRNVETAQEYVVGPAEIRRFVQRDLGYLFNAMNQNKWIDWERYPEVATSALNFGMAPMAGTYQTKIHWQSTLTHIKQIIRAYEPRLSRVQILSRAATAADSRTYNILSFQIVGEINIQPYPIEFVVQSSIDLESTRLLIHSVSTR